MNSLFLLLIGSVVLLLGHLYWHRLLVAFRFRPLVGADYRGLENFASSLPAGAIIYAIGAVISLAWGWAPLFVWLLIAGTFVGGFAHGVVDWLTANHAGYGGLELFRHCAGRAISYCMRSLLVLLTLFLSAIVLPASVVLLKNHPDAIIAIILHGLILLGAHALRQKLTENLHSVLILAGLLLILPALSLLANLDLDLDYLATNSKSVIVGFSAIILIFIVLASNRDQRGYSNLSARIVMGAIFTLFLVVLLALLIQRPALEFLSYYENPQLGNAMPSITAVVSLVALGLIPKFAITQENAGEPAVAGGVLKSASSVESLWVLLLLVILLSFVSLNPERVNELPDWSTTVLPDQFLSLITNALQQTTAVLGLPEQAMGSFVTYLFIILSWHFLVNNHRGFMSAASIPNSNLSLLNSSRGISILYCLIVLALTVTMLLWPVSLQIWIVFGVAAFLLLNLVIVSGALAALRLHQSNGLISILALCLSGFFWWLIAQQMWVAASHESWPTLLFITLLAGIGIWAHGNAVRQVVELNRRRLAH
ncbi:MAG: hypothetical protein ACI8P9_000170 [Parasphingorhabdus sp.]|jgi:hypothetical protein